MYVTVALSVLTRFIYFHAKHNIQPPVTTCKCCMSKYSEQLGVTCLLGGKLLTACTSNMWQETVREHIHYKWVGFGLPVYRQVDDLTGLG